MIRIAHTADVHWRGLSRHDEYREIFSAFIDDCKKNSVDHIFIGGDIFHTKTSGISPEYIDQLTWWLEEMSKVSQVHMMLGNHDGNLINPSRQDAVSPIVSALNNKRIFLYKKSGTYEFAPGYNWCVFSLFDEENWSSVKPVEGSVNIACFHGQVRGSITETGWNIDEGVHVEFFNEYDFAMLGDIHQRQVLGYKNGKPWIAYPGTPVQQNYAEQLEHGYLLWDIKSSKDWEVEFRKLPNLKPFVTLEWNGDNELLLKEANQFPKQSRFRIKSSIPMSQNDIQMISESLKGCYSASEITFKAETYQDSNVIKANGAVVEKSNIRSQETIISLLQNYCKDKKYINVDWSVVEKEVKKYLDSVASSDDITRGSSWSLKHLKWDNVFSYGEENEINFSKLAGIVGIFGSNRIGKSSIVGTIMYALFNTSDRGSMKNLHICNIRKGYCSARAIFDHDGKTYISERQTTKSYNKKGIVNASTSLNLFRMSEDGEAEDMCGEQRSDTEKSLKSLIGTSDDFLLTSFSSQGESDAFILLSSAKRRATLSKFLDLDVFDKMFELSNKDLNAYKARLKNYPEKDWVSLREKNEELSDSLTKKIKELSDLIDSSQIEMNEIRSQLSSHKDVRPVTQHELELQLSKVKNLELHSRNCAEKISSLQKEVESLEEKLNVLNNFFEEETIEDLKKNIEVINSLEKSISELKRIRDREELELHRQQKSLKLLDEVPCRDEYPSCKFIKNAHEDKSKIQQQSLKESNAKKLLLDAEKSVAVFDKESIENKLKKQEKAKSLISNIRLEISKKETEIEKNKSSCEETTKSLLSAQQKLSSLEEALKNDENYEVVNLRNKLETLSKGTKALDEAKLDAATQYGKVLSDIEKLKLESEERYALLKEMQNLEMICEAFSKKGLPLSITKSQLPLINAEIEKILHGIVDFTIELENDDETDATEVYINYGDSRRVIELCSGMEKTVASIAIRVALINISSLPKSDMFIIDEGFGTLDEAGVEACNRLLTSLKKYFRAILVITHVDGIKDIADTLIEITKIEKDSKVNFA